VAVERARISSVRECACVPIVPSGKKWHGGRGTKKHGYKKQLDGARASNGGAWVLVGDERFPRRNFVLDPRGARVASPVPRNLRHLCDPCNPFNCGTARRMGASVGGSGSRGRPTPRNSGKGESSGRSRCHQRRRSASGPTPESRVESGPANPPSNLAFNLRPACNGVLRCTLPRPFTLDKNENIPATKDAKITITGPADRPKVLTGTFVR
jgi:hypothetical protein